jgi:hypothetical protein
MKDCFVFRFNESSDDKRSSIVVYFSDKPDLDELIKGIKADIEKNPIYKDVYVICLDVFSSNLKDILTNSSFKKEFYSLIGSIEDNLISLVFTKDGSLKWLSNKKDVNDKLKETVVQSGALELFKIRCGVISSSENYHFLKPSGDHCDKFIRSSNLLVSGVEVSFLAVALLPYIKPNIKRIYVDTSSISYLIAVAIQLSELDLKVVPIIESFESYSAFNKAFDFVEDEDSLVFISATTSGSLTKKLLKEHCFAKHQIITLFYVGLPNNQIGLFNVADAIPGGIISVKPEACKMCQRGAKIINISGDQFLPETPSHELLMIRKTDQSKKREEFLEEFAAKGFLNWNQFSSPMDGLREHFYFSIDSLIGANSVDSFNKDLDKKIKKYVSRHTNVLLTVGDTDSKSLAYKIKDVIGGNVKVHHFSDDLDKKMESWGSVMVVAGAITSGRKLLSVSRKLRSLKPDASVTYFIGVSKLPTAETEEQLKKDLAQGGNELVILRRFPLPRVKEYSKTAWDLEDMFWRQFDDQDPFGNFELNPSEVLNNRYAIFKEGAYDKNNLFLLTPMKQMLKLRQTFVFWSDLNLNAENASQADVYWTVQAVLHDLRNQSHDKGLSSVYHSTLISPACFDRYNDGVIQASFLRAAKPVELNFAIDPDSSRLMTDIILSIVSNWGNAQGEASLEFLLALSTDRLRVCAQHLKEIVGLKSDGMPESLIFFLNYLDSQKH